MVSAAGEDFSQENDLVVPFADGDIEVEDAGARAFEVGEFVVVGREKRPAVDRVVEKFGDAPCDRESVECRCAAADFVEDDEAAGGGIVEDVGGLVHLDHERGLAAREVVVGADAGEDSVSQAGAHRLRGHVASHLGEQNEKRDLAEVGGFSGHVRSSEDRESCPLLSQVGVVWNKPLTSRLLVEHRMASLLNVQDRRLLDFRAAVSVQPRGLGERAERIERGEGVRGFLEFW